MSYFSYNYYKNLNRPNVYLAYPNKKTIGALRTYKLQNDIMANSANTGSFIVYRYEDGEPTKYYDEINIGKYIHIYGVDWFRINEVSIINEGFNEYKEVTIISLECELGQTYLTSFGSLGTDDDEQGGLDRYCLYDPLDAKHSIMHIFLQKNPGWSIKYIDDDISKEYRNFQEDSVDSYSFLTDTVAETYECVFIFDSYEKSVSAYKLENLGKDTQITFNYRNVIKNIEMSSNEDDIKTVLTVVGGNNERTNTSLGVINVNISGTNQIYNFSYYMSMMSTELQDKLKEYDELCKVNEEQYQELMSSLLSHYQELNDLKDKVPDEGEDSTDWTKFGLVELEEKEIIYKTNMSLYLSDDESDLYQENAQIHAEIEAEIAVKKNQITIKEEEISNVQTQITNLVVNLPEVLGDDLYKELGSYIREDTLTDDSFVATNIMTDDEILKMQQELLAHGRNELEKICYPQFTFKVDLINFTVDYDYKMFTDNLEMFNIIHINFEDHDSIVSARLLKMHINWDDPNDFSVTFSNRNSLKETWQLFEEIKNQTEDLSSKVDFSTGAWKNAAIVSVNVNEYMNNILNASKQQLVNNNNNEVKIDSTGIICRKWIEEKQTYDPGQIWITNNQIAITTDAWNSVGLALGYVKVKDEYFFGLCADTIIGRLLISEKLMVSNESGTYTIDEDGMIAKNGSYQVKINPNDPAEIFSISIDNSKLLYVDTNNKKLKFEGDIESKSGHIANYTISTNDLISGNVGMSSNISSGAIAFWAGNTNRNSAPFRVSNTGVLTASSVYITGGQLNIGNGNFTVNSSGILTAKGANISGTVTATSGKIGNWVIENGSLKGEGDARLYVQRDGSTFFMVNNARIALGGFEVTYTSRDIFQSYDEYTGLSANPDDNSKFCLWGGYTGGTVTNTRNYAICVNGGGQTYTKELHANYIYGVAGDSDTSDGWTIGEYLDWIYGELDSTSDKTAKDNITDIDNEEALNLILKSKPVTFQYKTTGQWSAGFIAQDVDTLQDELEVYYPLTGYNDKSEKYKIYYRTYIPLLVSCIQNLQNQINELKGININDRNNIEINNTEDTE